jgi:predicted nucleic acid-binding protein
LIAWAILDTGPLVAYIERRESLHLWAIDQFRLCEPGIRTCEPVLTEALFILRRYGQGHELVMRLLERGILTLDFDLKTHLDDVRELMDSYADLPMSLADACLVRMTELNPRAEIITLDRHFKRYRTRDRRVLSLRLPPEIKP